MSRMMNEAIQDRLAGNVVVVTGSASGIGKAKTPRILKEGACVVIGDVDRCRAARLAETVHARNGLERFGFEACDVSEEFNMMNLLRYTMERFGRLGFMINKATMGGCVQISS